MTSTPGTSDTPAPTRELSIEFLYLDLDTCTRCRATDATLREAIAHTRPALEATGVAVRVTPTHVSDEALARTHRFVSSPTIRIDGVDVAGEVVESACDACSEGCACMGGVDCRDWLYRDQRSTVPPVGLLVEALLRHAVGADPGLPGAPPSASGRPEAVPENLRRSFAAAAPAGGGATVAAERPAPGCCPTEVLAACCEPEEKADCCGDGATGAARAAPAACGC